MLDIVEHVLENYDFAGNPDPERIANSRERVARYVEKLASAGQRDVHLLSIYALAYLKEMHEGPDLRFSGC